MGRPTRLAIVGASARAAAQSALRAGFDAVTADLFADEDLRRLCPATRIPQADYPDGLADWLAEQDVDAWMYTGALENHPDLVDRMSEIKPLWGNRGKALRRSRDALWLARNHAGFPHTRPDPPLFGSESKLDGSLLCKTYQSAGGAGVWPLDSEQALRRAEDANAVFQRRVDGVSVSLSVLVANGAANRLGATRQLVGLPEFGASEFQYCGSVVLEDLGALRDTSWWDVSFLAEIGLTGLVGLDLVIEHATESSAGDGIEGGAHVVEINPRYTASMELHDSFAEQPLIAAHAEASAGETHPDTEWRQCPQRRGKAILYAKQTAIVKRGFSQWALDEAGAHRLADIPAAGARIETGQPVLTILEGGPPGGVLDRLKARAAEVESRLYA